METMCHSGRSLSLLFVHIQNKRSLKREKSVLECCMWNRDGDVSSSSGNCKDTLISIAGWHFEMKELREEYKRQ